MLVSFVIGLVIVAVIVIVAYLATHHTNPTLPPAKDVVSGVLAGMPTVDDIAGAVREELKAVPAMVSDEVGRLQSALEAAVRRATAAEADAVDAKAAHKADLAAVATRVTVAIAGSPELPPPPPSAPEIQPQALA